MKGATHLDGGDMPAVATVEIERMVSALPKCKQCGEIPRIARQEDDFYFVCGCDQLPPELHGVFPNIYIRQACEEWIQRNMEPCPLCKSQVRMFIPMEEFEQKNKCIICSGCGWIFSSPVLMRADELSNTWNSLRRCGMVRFERTDGKMRYKRTRTNK